MSEQFSVHEIERALSAAGLEEGADNTPYWDGRFEAVEIVREMLGLNDKIDASLAECCEGHAKFGVCYNDPEDER